jgi:phage/plasmid primase-like uncharacterized protein
MTLSTQQIERAERARSCCVKATAIILGATKLKRVTFKVEWAGPCPVCGGDDRFSVNTVLQAWNCRRCKRGGRDSISLVGHALGLDLKSGEGFNEALDYLLNERSEPIASVSAPKSKPEPGDDNVGKAKAIWNRSQEPGALVERYLRDHRHYHGPIPQTIRFLPAYNDLAAAMITPYALSIEDVRAVHLTRLNPDGTKIGKKITIGKGAQGHPIALFPPDGRDLAITEGIEDALLIHEAKGWSAWAAGCAGRLPDLAETVPDSVPHVRIISDDDADGRRDATELARRLRKRGVPVTLKFFGVRHAVP